MTCPALRNIPNSKIDDTLHSIISDCKTCSTNGATLSGGMCERCELFNKLFNRYATSNIPVLYWKLEMGKDFKGDEILREYYDDTVKDIKKTYRDGKNICFAGSFGLGKQLSLDTELPTPSGFIKLRDLKEGDRLFDENGEICNVTKLHPINISPESYEIIFDDGTSVQACADHLWLTWTKDARKDHIYSLNPTKHPEVRSTKDILNTLKIGITKPTSNHSIPCAKPLKYPEADLPIDPYVLGCWIGDGASLEGSIECADDDILKQIKKSGYSINVRKSTINNNSKSCSYRIGDLIPKDNTNKTIGRLTKELKEMGLIKNKHIPDIYLTASYDQRLALLQGLMDTDGCCNKKGGMEFTSIIEAIAEKVCQIVISLGIKCKVKCNKSFLNGVRYKDRYRVTFTTQLPVFRVKRKLDRTLTELKAQLNRTEHRYIVSIVPIDPIPMRCITVDSPSHLFLITRSLIATHNTMVCANILKRVVEKGYSAVYITLPDIISVITSGDRYAARSELLSVDFLVVDEFDPRYMGTDNAADFFGRTIEDILRTRSQNCLPTFMCTNSPNLTDGFTGSIKESLSSLMNMVETVIVLGSDYRDPDNRGE